MRTVVVCNAALLLVVAVSCKSEAPKGDTSASAPAASATAAAVASQAPPAAPSASVAGTTATVSGLAPECADYVKAMTCFLEKRSPANAATTIQQMRDGYAKAGALATSGCRQGVRAMASSLEEAGCSAAAGATLATVTASQTTGVPECDAYSAAMECYVKQITDEGMKTTTKLMMSGLVAQIKADPSLKTAFAQRCTASFAQAQDDLARVGCAPPASRGPTQVIVQTPGTGTAAATTTVTMPPAPASGDDPHAAHAGRCKRLKPGTKDLMCALGTEVCCENVASGQEKCAPRQSTHGIRCGDDGAWLVAVGCTTSSMCGPAQKCCVQEPVPGFLQTVCAVNCQHEEACVPNLAGAQCKNPSAFDCVASDASRTGARCVAKAGAQPGVVHCAAGLVRIVAAGKPGGACVQGCGSICSGGEGPVEATYLNDDGTPGGKVNVRPSDSVPVVTTTPTPRQKDQCTSGQSRIAPQHMLDCPTGKKELQYCGIDVGVAGGPIMRWLFNACEE